jgi:hypothetical protein
MGQRFAGQRNSAKVIGNLMKVAPRDVYPIKPLPIAQRQPEERLTLMTTGGFTWMALDMSEAVERK